MSDIFYFIGLGLGAIIIIGGGWQIVKHWLLYSEDEEENTKA